VLVCHMYVRCNAYVQTNDEIYFTAATAQNIR
jgi:hypothetical protein